MTDNDHYWVIGEETKPRHVKIVPGSMGSFFMDIEGGGRPEGEVPRQLARVPARAGKLALRRRGLRLHRRAPPFSSSVSTMRAMLRSLSPVGERQELHPLRAAPGLPDLAHAGADALALGRQQHDLAAVAHAQGAGDVDRAVLGQVDRDHAGAAAADQAVVLERGPLADPVLAGDQQAVERVADLDGLHVVARRS